MSYHLDFSSLLKYGKMLVPIKKTVLESILRPIVSQITTLQPVALWSIILEPIIS